MRRCYLNLLMFLLTVNSFTTAFGQTDDKRNNDAFRAAIEADRIRPEERDGMRFYDAVYEGDLATVKRLVAGGVAVNTKGVHQWRGRSALMYAALRGHEAIFDYLLSKGARTDGVD